MSSNIKNFIDKETNEKKNYYLTRMAQMHG